MNSNQKNTLPPWTSRRLYAVEIEFDDSQIEALCPESPEKAHLEVKKIMNDFGFFWSHGDVYFGDASQVTPVTCVLVVQALHSMFGWFKPSVRSVRMLRVEENTDLSLAI